MSKFECKQCKKTFNNPDKWSHEDRVKEATANFGGGFLGTDEQVSVCDDCYNSLMNALAIHIGPPVYVDENFKIIEEPSDGS